MKSSFKLLAAFVAASLATVAAFAADPTGTWKWTSQGRQGGQSFESTLKLELKDGVLSGKIMGMQGPQGQIPDVAISEASFKDDTVAFSVTREFNGNKFTTKYSGKLEGDAIKGSSERPGRDGTVTKRDWNPTRAK